ncbi:MAG: hypothetical protein P8M80_08115 [Pirellulaceae bacterium]|nr:hypothetical protein [Pirellulaceae bacterium]
MSQDFLIGYIEGVVYQTIWLSRYQIREWTTNTFPFSRDKINWIRWGVWGKAA